MRRLLILALLFFVLATSFLCAQMGKEWGTTWKSLGTDKEQAAKALKTSGKILESDAKTEFFIVPTKSEVGAKTFMRWDFGGKELNSQNSLFVDFQVGEYEGKPVFLLFRVPREKGQEGIDDATRVLSSAFSDNA